MATSAPWFEATELETHFGAIKNRQDMPAYADAPVSDADMEKVLRSATQAPGAANGQPRELAVICDHALLLIIHASYADSFLSVLFRSD